MVPTPFFTPIPAAPCRTWAPFGGQRCFFYQQQRPGGGTVSQSVDFGYEPYAFLYAYPGGPMQDLNNLVALTPGRS